MHIKLQKKIRVTVDNARFLCNVMQSESSLAVQANAITTIIIINNN